MSGWWLVAGGWKEAGLSPATSHQSPVTGGWVAA
jgi:hypothetical protein